MADLTSRQTGKRIALLGVPVEVGASQPGALMGPAALRTAGLGPLLENLGFSVEDHGDISAHDLVRADDAPPYFTILIVGHIVIPAMLIMQKMDDPSNLLLTVIFVPLTLFLSIGLIRPIKGAIVGLMMSFNMLKPDTEIG